MTTEEMFKFGITPKTGEDAGVRYRVMCIMADGVSVCDWDGESKTVKKVLNHGEYELWQPPKTLFEDSNIPPTVGNLKKAIAELPDDVEIFHKDLVFGYDKASFELRKFGDRQFILVM